MTKSCPSSKAAHIELQEIEGLLDRRLYYEFVVAEGAEVVPSLVCYHHLSQHDLVRTFGLEHLDDFVEVETFDERLIILK